jgi:hypothetical protein
VELAISKAQLLNLLLKEVINQETLQCNISGFFVYTHN